MTAPARIWATVNGMSTRLPDGGRQFVGGWSEDNQRLGSVEYVRADLTPTPAPQADVARSARSFMELFAGDDCLTVEDIDPNELACRYDALSRALAATTGSVEDYSKSASGYNSPPHLIAEDTAPEKDKTLSVLIEESKARYAAMTEEERSAMWQAQRESFARGMTTPCEHGVLDFEHCPDCRNPAPQPNVLPWLDIATALRGTEILVWNGRRRHVAVFDKVEDEWVSSFKTTTKRLPVLPPPTHWQPLPNGPATEGSADV